MSDNLITVSKKKNTPIIGVILVLLTFILIKGCGGNGNISKAKLLGYDGRSFEDTVEKIADDMKNEEVADFSYEWKKGWNGINAPNDDVLTSDEKAMTYIMSINLAYDGETELNRMVFYMVHNTKNNTLYAEGGYFDEDGDIYPMSKSEAREELNDLFEGYN